LQLFKLVSFGRQQQRGDRPELSKKKFKLLLKSFSFNPTMAAGTIQKFFTDHGEVHYVKEKNGRKHFSFVNPKLDSNHRETIAYFKTFSALANYLPEAQLAAKNFIRLRDSPVSYTHLTLPTKLL
jgi:hypothetical protein